MSRADLELRDLAALGGWTERLSIRDRDAKTPRDPIVFVKGSKHLWEHGTGATCAEVTDGKYINHRHYTTLEEAMSEES